MIGSFIADDGLNNPIREIVIWFFLNNTSLFWRENENYCDYDISQVGQRNSRDVTLRKAKEAIKHLCAQLRLKVIILHNYYNIKLCDIIVNLFNIRIIMSI